MFFATGAYDAGVKFIERAFGQYQPVISGSASGLAIAGSMRLRASVMAARDLRHRNDAWDHLAQAREIGERIGRDTNHYGLIFGPANVKIHEIATALELEDADEAADRRASRRHRPCRPSVQVITTST